MAIKNLNEAKGSGQSNLSSIGVCVNSIFIRIDMHEHVDANVEHSISFLPSAAVQQKFPID